MQALPRQIIVLLIVLDCAEEAEKENVVYESEFFSCAHHPEWQAYAATLDAERIREQETPRGDDPASIGLPKVCARWDEKLLRWSDQLVADYGTADSSWDKLQEAHHCMYTGDNDTFSDQCFTESTPCIYGIISATICITVMYAWNAENSPQWEPYARAAAANVKNSLMSADKFLEFYDSSSWPFTLEDIATIIDAFALSSPPSSDVKAGFDGLPTTTKDYIAKDLINEFPAEKRPWTPSSRVWREAEAAVRRSFQMIASWGLPQPEGAVIPKTMMQQSVLSFGQESEPALVRIWAFGTHCSVMAEPVSAMALLLQNELRLKVTWRGTRDYCLHNGTWPVPILDEGSAVKNVLETFVQKTDISKRSFTAHRDILRSPGLFAESFGAALAQDDDFMEADLAFCSEPAFACLQMHKNGKPIIGYFGVHIGFLLHESEHQLQCYNGLRDIMTLDARSSFATVAPYISLQVFYHVPVEIPAVRPISLYTAPAVYTGSREFSILINKRPICFWDVFAIIQRTAKISGLPWNVVDASALTRGANSYSDWASFRAAVYFPYDWLQTMTFYDFVNMGIPTFVPSSPIYAFALGTNAPLHYRAKSWNVASQVYPYHYGDWGDLVGRAFWWQMTDFMALPGVAIFSSIAEMFDRISSQQDLWILSGKLRLAQIERATTSALFWRGALIRALAPSSP